MKRSILTLFIAPVGSATPHDGINLNQPFIIPGDLIDAGLRDFSISYLALQELDDAPIVL